MRLNVCVQEPLQKEKSEKDIADPGNNLYHTLNLTNTKFLEHKRNEEILEEIKVEPVDGKLRYKHNWLRHVTRMNKQQEAKNNAEL
jgi:hypothetical protein